MIVTVLTSRHSEGDSEDRKMTRLSKVVVCSLASLLAGGKAADAALVAHYTLDNADAATVTGSGLQNLGTDGTTSNLTRTPTGASDASSVSGLIGNALRFNGTQAYIASAAGNAGTDLSDYPFTFSIWMANIAAADTGSRAAISVSSTTSNGRFNTLGVNTNEFAEGIRRNSNSINGTSTPDGLSLAGTAWHNVVGVFGPNPSARTTTLTLYIDGKSPSGQQTVAEWTFADTNINALLIGAFTNGSSTIVNPFKGDLDDAGLFNVALGDADVALINGLGRTSALGLDWLDEAQTLNAAAVNSTALINGKTWKHVTGLAGTIGDWGGTFAGGDAFIVTGAGGNGIQIVPEPAALALLSLGGLILFRRSDRR